MSPALGVMILVAPWIAEGADPQSRPRQPGQLHPYRDAFFKKTFGWSAAVGISASVGWNHVRNNPEEWGRGTSGFAKRLGSSYGRHVIKNAIKYPIAGIRHEAIGYVPSGKRGFRRRITYALMSTVITRKTTTEEKTIALGQISGTVGSAFLSRLWQPDRLHTVSSGFSTTGISFGIDAGINVVREFWPEIRHPKQHRNPDPPRAPGNASLILTAH
ncbi:MAG: hypothetical protein ABI823_20640 [Bryobacteraceae bacterium]